MPELGFPTLPFHHASRPPDAQPHRQCSLLRLLLLLVLLNTPFPHMLQHQSLLLWRKFLKPSTPLLLPLLSLLLLLRVSSRAARVGSGCRLLPGAHCAVPICRPLSCTCTDG